MSLTREQLEIRRTRIGSSDIGAIIGVDPHRRAFDVFNEKVLPVPDDPSPEMEWGQTVESTILAWHSQREGKMLVGTTTLIHPSIGFACATPDAYLSEGEYRPDLAGCKVRLVEAKNVGWYRADAWGSEGDDAPFKFLAQVHWQLGVAKAAEVDIEVIDEADLVPSIGGCPPRVYRVNWDAELFGILVDKAAKFVRDHLQTGKAPELDGSDSATEYLRRRFQIQREDLLPPSDEAAVLHKELLMWEATAKEADKNRTEAEQKLKLLCGEAAGIDGIATWKKSKNGSRRFLPVRPKKTTNGAGARP